jgi:membrane peptidoglycan carboxypeptidase
MLSREIALTISDILSDNVARTPLYGSNSLLYFPGRDVAAKTGTTNDYRDAWIVGYTPNLTVGAWAGNNDNTSMDHQISGLIITPMWREFMDVALPKLSQEKFPEPQATPQDLKPILRGVWFDPAALVLNEEDNSSGSSTPTLNLGSTIGSAHTILHYVQKDNPQGPYPSNPQSDSQYTLWEYPVSVWKANILRAAGEETNDNDDETVGERDDNEEEE